MKAGSNKMMVILCPHLTLTVHDN